MQFQHLPAIALPFYAQLHASDNHQTIAGSPPTGGHSKNNAQMLPLFCISFHSIFGIWMCIGLTLPIVDLPFLQYFPDLLFCNMPAFHAASGMTGKDQAADMTIDGVSLTCLGRLSATSKTRNDEQADGQCRYKSEFHGILILSCRRYGDLWYFAALGVSLRLESLWRQCAIKR